MLHFQTVSVSSAEEQPANKGNQDVDLHYVPIDQYLDMKINGCWFVQYVMYLYL